MNKRKSKFDFKGFLKDAITTIVNLPIHLCVAVYAAFAQCFIQLRYDIANNIYEVYDVKEEN
jgi:hypothetical protein